MKIASGFCGFLVKSYAPENRLLSRKEAVESSILGQAKYPRGRRDTLSNLRDDALLRASESGPLDEVLSVIPA